MSSDVLQTNKEDLKRGRNGIALSRSIALPHGYRIDQWTTILVVIGLALRMCLIFPGPFASKVEFFTNKADLRNYYWPAQAALNGDNPYALWANGQSGEFRADMAPAELALYVGTVAVWNDPRAIQVLFALFDAVNIVLLGILLKQSRLRLPFQLFYALGPLTLYNLVLVPQDKTIVLTLTFLIFLFLKQDAKSKPRSALGAIIAAGLLAAFKWLSVFYLLPLLLAVSRNVRDFIKNGLIFASIVALTHVPWFPSWLYVYTFRAGRTAAPMHTSPAALLNALGLFDKNLLLVVLAASLLTVYALFWFKRIDIFETMALSVAAGVLWTPDMDPVHLALVVLYFLLVVDWSSRGRQLLVWGAALWVAVVYALSTRTGFTRYGLPDLRSIVGAYGSPQMIVLSYVLFVVIFTLYLLDRSRHRPTGQEVLAPDTYGA